MVRLFDEIKKKVKASIPPSVRIKNVEFEGPTLVIYVENPQELAEADIVKKLAKELRLSLIHI